MISRPDSNNTLEDSTSSQLDYRQVLISLSFLQDKLNVLLELCSKSFLDIVQHRTDGRYCLVQCPFSSCVCHGDMIDVKDCLVM